MNVLLGYCQGDGRLKVFEWIFLKVATAEFQKALYRALIG